MKFLFQFGNNFSLSQAEIAARFPELFFEKKMGNFALFSGEKSSKYEKKFSELGGAIRFFEVFSETDFSRISAEISDFLRQKIPTGKILFGILAPGKFRRKILLETKKNLKKSGRSARFLNRDFRNLDAGTLFREKLFSAEKAAEIAVLPAGGKFFLAETRAAQNVEDFATRDFGKPVRDMAVGMLPPKIALAMTNFSADEKGNLPAKIWDPFCGTGTILIEAARLGISVFGSDISQKMIAASNKNFVHFFPKKAAEIFWHDATTKIPQKVSDAVVVSEGFLGPIFRAPLSDAQFFAAKKKVEPIFQKFFAAAQKAKISKIVISMPFWRLQNGKNGFCKNTLDFAKTFWKNDLAVRFRRENQIVGREILVFRDVPR